jgi:hypothetical protein
MFNPYRFSQVLFASAQVFNILDFGAHPDGKTYVSKQFFLIFQQERKKTEKCQYSAAQPVRSCHIGKKKEKLISFLQTP